MLKPLYTLLWCLLLLKVYSQTEYKNWYFGYGTDGLIFDQNNIPYKVSDKAFQVGFEGMIVVSDPISGVLKFYSDGEKVIDKNHNVMTSGTGLTGHMSGAQSVQCCPVPGSCEKKYYLFTNSAWDHSGGKISYSIVDFTSNPLGVVTNKNSLFWNGTSDQAMCLVNKPNSNDYWLISSKRNIPEYYVWKITSTGISTPIIYTFTNTGENYQMNYDKTTGQIIVTGNGNLHTTIIKFNSSTGVLSSETTLGIDFTHCYAARFSPDGSKLYIGAKKSWQNNPSLYQYDFLNTTWTSINDTLPVYAHDIKMAPDGKMYHIHTYNGSQPMAVIGLPNNSAMNNACNYHTVNFVPNFNGEVRRFPEFVTLPSPPIANIDSIAINSTLSNLFVMANDSDLQGDPLFLDSIIFPPKHGIATIVSDHISYVTNALTCGLRDTLIYRIKDINCSSDTAIVIISFPTSFPKTIDTTICKGDTLFGYFTSGTYIDTLPTYAGCDTVRTINLTVKPKSFSTINQSICQGQSYLGHSTTGTFIDTLISVNGCDSIRTLRLTVKDRPNPNLGLDKEICLDDTIVLYAGAFDSYIWQDNSVLDHFIVRGSGRYSVIVTNSCGSKQDEIEISEKLCNEYFPNAFTPNIDGRNDVFKILNASNLKDYILAIYNRWGQKVFETKDHTKGWNGTLSNKPQQSGVYVFYCNYKKNNIPIKTKGTLILIR